MFEELDHYTYMLKDSNFINRFEQKKDSRTNTNNHSYEDALIDDVNQSQNEYNDFDKFFLHLKVSVLTKT